MFKFGEVFRVWLSMFKIRRSLFKACVGLSQLRATHDVEPV